MNKKGQALVEFILILPVLILIMVFLVDICNITYKKYNLENNLETVIELYKNKKEIELKKYLSENNLTSEYSNEGDITKIKLKKKIKLNTPGLTTVLGKNYEIETDRVIYNE